MNNNGKAWEKIVAQISGPRDLFAILCGAALGVGITQISHSASLVTAAIAGARLGIMAGKLIITSSQGPALRRRANNLRRLISRLPPSSEKNSLLDRLDLETRIWKDNIYSNNEYNNQLSKLIHDFKYSV